MTSDALPQPADANSLTPGPPWAPAGLDHESGGWYWPYNFEFWDPYGYGSPECEAAWPALQRVRAIEPSDPTELPAAPRVAAGRGPGRHHGEGDAVSPASTTSTRPSGRGSSRCSTSTAMRRSPSSTARPGSRWNRRTSTTSSCRTTCGACARRTTSRRPTTLLPLHRRRSDRSAPPRRRTLHRARFLPPRATRSS